LSFIGFGLQPPAPNWGYMINENRIILTTNPWAVVAPAILIAILTVGLNTFTDAIARVALGIDRAEMVIAEAAGTGSVSEIPA
jgi:peptide/nickel transport system permease protein